MHFYTRSTGGNSKSYYQECLKATENMVKPEMNWISWRYTIIYSTNNMIKRNALADSTSIQLTWENSFQANIYAKEQNYKGDALRALRKLRVYRILWTNHTDCRPVGTKIMRIGNEQLKRKAQALQLENTQLNLQKTTLELQQTKSQRKSRRWTPKITILLKP